MIGFVANHSLVFQVNPLPNKVESHCLQPYFILNCLEGWKELCTFAESIENYS